MIVVGRRKQKIKLEGKHKKLRKNHPKNLGEKHK
jgi:hypothetical protein